jgi:heme A synthase
VASSESMQETTDPTRLKVRFILLPLVGLAASFLIVYSLLNWLLVQRANLVPLDDDVVAYWLPGLAGWVLVILLVQPALGLLKKDKKGNLILLVSPRRSRDGRDADDNRARIYPPGSWKPGSR